MSNISPGGTPIQALVIGNGEVSADVVGQLAKNSRFNISWVGENIENTEFEEKESDNVVRIEELSSRATPMTINELVEKHQPDIIFLCQRTSQQWGLEDTIGSDNLEREMLGTIADSELGQAPVITVSVEQ